jgi:hypothetical protein
MILAAPFISKKLIDADATAFVAASGATDFDAINRFVIGIKTLGLYNSMVCWPLRSSQNAGTGSTAYSLGGLGTYNGTLVNGPTWGADGLTGALAISAITTSLALTTGNSSRSVFGVWKNLSSNQFNPVGTTAAGIQRFVLRSNSQTTASADLFNGITHDNFGSTTVPSGINFSALSYNSATSGIIFKANSNIASTLTLAKNFTSSNLILGGYDIPLYGLGIFSMAAAFDLVALSETQIDNLRMLYKSTLGQGLGLP